MRDYRRLSLETGAMEFFEPARRLYRKFGFEQCGPFSTYKEDSNSVFFTKILSLQHAEQVGGGNRLKPVPHL